MKPISGIIVDDEGFMREVLKKMISQHTPYVEILGEASSADEAVELIKNEHPEVVFLDIDMPEKSGFDVVAEIQNLQVLPKIIFVTSHDHYAIKAVKCAAFDYLVKPVKGEELVACCNRYLEIRSDLDIKKSIDVLLEHLEIGKLTFTTRSGCFFVDPEKIVYFAADGNYTHIILTNDTKKTVTLNIGSVYKMLNTPHFIRISRSIIINKKFLSEMNKSNKLCTLKVNDKDYTLRYHSSFIKDL